MVSTYVWWTPPAPHPSAASYLLAFVYGYLGEHDLLRVRTDTEKYLLVAALNLVECVADVGSITSSRRSRAPAWVKMG